MQEVGSPAKSESTSPSTPRKLGKREAPLLLATKKYARIPTTRNRPNHTQVNRRRKEKYVTQQLPQQNSVTGLDSEAEHSKLQRGLSFRHIQLIAIGGAIGTGLFLGSAKTIALTGPSIVFVYAIIGSVIYFVLRAMGEILLSNPKYKSFTDFITDILGLRAGFFVGWSYWFFWVVTGIADVIAITGYVQYWLPDVPKFIPALTVIVALLLLNLPSVKNFGEIEFWFAVIKIVAIVLLIVVGTSGSQYCT